MSAWFHVSFAIIVGGLYGFLYFKNRYMYQLCLSVWAFSTLLQYISNNRIFIIVLSVVQILFMMLTFYFLFASKKKRMNKLYQKLSQNSADNLVETQENPTEQAQPDKIDTDISE